MVSAPSSAWSRLAQELTLLSLVWLVGQSTLTWADAYTEPWRWWALGMTAGPIALFLTGSLLAWLGGRWLRRIGWTLAVLVTLTVVHHALRFGLDLVAAWPWR